MGLWVLGIPGLGHCREGDLAGEEGVRCFLIYNHRAPTNPINLGAVFTKTVSYDFSNKYISQSDGVLFRLNASRSRHLSVQKIHRGGRGAWMKLRRHKNLCKHVVIYRLRKRKGMGEEDRKRGGKHTCLILP